MSAGSLNLYIEQGATYGITFEYRDGSGSLVNLTGHTARMHVRAQEESGNVIIELTTENGRIILGGPAGTIQLHITAIDTAALNAGTGLVYDLELISGATVWRLLEGTAVIDREVTR